MVSIYWREKMGSKDIARYKDKVKYKIKELGRMDKTLYLRKYKVKELSTTDKTLYLKNIRMMQQLLKSV